MTSARLLSPVLWIGLAVFFSIAAPVDLWPALAPLETVSVAMALVTAALRLMTEPSKARLTVVLATFVAVLAVLLAPLATSLATHGSLDVLSDPSYRHFAKFVLVVGAAAVVTQSPTEGKAIRAAILWSLGLLAVHAVYRFVVLDQGNLDTGRMELPFRHGDPNFLCVFMAIGLGLGAARLATAWRDGERLFVGASTVLLVLFAVTAWLTASRGGLMAILLMAAILIFRIPGRPGPAVRAVTLASLVLLAFAFDGERLTGRLETLSDQSALGRIDGLRAGLASFVDHPTFGLGYNRSSDAMRRIGAYPHFPSEEGILTIHNTPMQVIAELGLVGMLAYGFGVALLVLASRRSRTLGGDSDQAAFVAILAGVALAVQTLPMAYNGSLVGVLGLLALARLGTEPLTSSGQAREGAR